MEGATSGRNLKKMKIPLSENNRIIGKRQYTLVKCLDCKSVARNVFCVYGIPIMKNNIITSVQSRSKPFIACSKCFKRIGARVMVICDICKKENDKPKCFCITTNTKNPIIIEEKTIYIDIPHNNNVSSSDNPNSSLSYKFKKFSFDDALYDQNKFPVNISYVPRIYDSQLNYENELQRNIQMTCKRANDQQNQEENFQNVNDQQNVPNVIYYSKEKQNDQLYEEKDYYKRIFKKNPYLPTRQRRDQKEIEEIKYVDSQNIIVKFDSIDDISLY